MIITDSDESNNEESGQLYQSNGSNSGKMSKDARKYSQSSNSAGEQSIQKRRRGKKSRFLQKLCDISILYISLSKFLL